jgi:hypothetical protein
MGITNEGLKNRIDKQIPFSGHIFFSTKSGFLEEELKNYSKNGLFIKTNEDLTLGEFITVALCETASDRVDAARSETSKKEH